MEMPEIKDRVHNEVVIPGWIGQKYTYEEWPDHRMVYCHVVSTPKKPPKTKIPNHKKRKKDQKFEIPDQEMVWRIDRKWRNRKQDGSLVDPLSQEEIDFVKLQWHYRRNGFWFFNNGYLEYITGEHWFYLSYYKIEVREQYTLPGGKKGYTKRMQLPYFVDSDRDRFYLWEEVKASNNTAGLLEITNRRDGKSYRACCSCYYASSGRPTTNSAVQSKNDPDARAKVKTIVAAWNEMPAFFRPIDSGYSNPKSGINFEAPNTFSKDDRLKIRALNSSIKPFPSGAVQLDGFGIAVVYQDEVGKTEKEDIYERWYVTKETLVDGAAITGKAILTTTVEDLDKRGGRQCLDLWNDSDMKKLNGLGQTQSGLWPYFKPAFYGFRGDDENVFIDEYGYSDCEKAIDYQLKYLEGKSGQSLWARQRKYPHNEEQAFRSAGDDDVFDVTSIFEQIDYNESLGKGRYRVGRFFGDIESREAMKFVDDSEGPFKISWMPDAKRQNGPWPRKGYSKPYNDELGIFGLDSFDHKKTVDNRRSCGSIAGQFDVNPLERIMSTGYFFSYLHRPPSPHIFYEDATRAFAFYGMQCLIENQKPGVLNYMNRVGAGGFIFVTNRKVTTINGSYEPVEGLSTSGDFVRDKLVSGMMEYVLKFVGSISEQTQMEDLSMSKEEVKGPVPGFFYFNEVLRQLAEFNVDDWEKYDAVVSSMLSNFAIRYRHRNDLKRTSKVAHKLTSDDFFGSFDSSGDEAVPLQP